MTRDDILNMPASREMDALIANMVMGWKWVTTQRMADGELTGISRDEGGVTYVDTVPNYSKGLSAAWEVVNICHQYKIGSPSNLGNTFAFVQLRMKSAQATADTAPLAICRAALLAVMDDTGGK